MATLNNFEFSLYINYNSSDEKTDKLGNITFDKWQDIIQVCIWWQKATQL